MTETQSVKNIVFTQQFFATAITIVTILISIGLLWLINMGSGFLLMGIYCLLIPLPFILCLFVDFSRDDSQVIWLRPVLILVFSVSFVSFFYSEVDDYRYVKYAEYKKLIQSNPDLGDKAEFAIHPDFKKIEKDTVIRRYEMMHVNEAIGAIRSAQKTIAFKQKEKIIEDQAKHIKVSIGQQL